MPTHSAAKKPIKGWSVSRIASRDRWRGGAWSRGLGRAVDVIEVKGYKEAIRHAINCAKERGWYQHEQSLEWLEARGVDPAEVGAVECRNVG